MNRWAYFGLGVVAAVPLAYVGLRLFRARVFNAAVERGGPALRAELARSTSGLTAMVNTPEYERLTDSLVGIGVNAGLETIGIPRVE